MIVEVIICTRERKIIEANPFTLKEYLKTFGPFVIDGLTVKVFSQFYAKKDQVEEIVYLNYYKIKQLSLENHVYQ
jgi:hypothetical protein